MPIDMVQKLVVEVDSKKLLIKYLNLALPTVLNFYEEIAIKILDYPEKSNFPLPSTISHEETILPIVLIEGWYKDKKHSFFDDYMPYELFTHTKATDTIKKSINFISNILESEARKVWEVKFKEKCGDGYYDCFHDYYPIFDGAIKTGFRLESCKCFIEILAISLCHIYYGK